MLAEMLVVLELLRRKTTCKAILVLEGGLKLNTETPCVSKPPSTRGRFPLDTDTAVSEFVPYLTL